MVVSQTFAVTIIATISCAGVFGLGFMYPDKFGNSAMSFANIAIAVFATHLNNSRQPEKNRPQSENTQGHNSETPKANYSVGFVAAEKPPT